MAKCHLGFVIFISGMMGVWLMVTAEVRHGSGANCGRIGWVAGVKPFLMLLRPPYRKDW
jgi:hypothetical protein